ncbi:MAG TPA: type 2 lanthipeptide synthetase LanM, partial [Thermoanaerobaculia bacterium]|nr:type 2 lanthipeptide synthetase LanM [Thermoanaerobaculia bacterium]
MIEAAELRLIAERSETLDEALARPRGAGGVDLVRATVLRDAWRRALGADAATFQRRLSWDGLTEEDVVAALGSRRPDDAALPAWTDLLVEADSHAPDVADAVASGAALDELAGFPPAALPRFAEVWVPFLRAAHARLELQAGDPLKRFSASARRSMDEALLAELGALGESALFQLFDLHREAAGGAPIPTVPPRRRLYRAFVGGLLGGGLVPLFLELSVLARAAATLALDWAAANAELAGRLAADSAALAEAFGAAGLAVGLSPALSDRHEGGRSVAVLAFESNARVVYKPRTVALEAAWSDFLSWLGRDVRDPPAALRVLSRPGYGWIEHVSAAPLGSREDASLHFRKGGALLAAAWALGARDLQMDNVLATAAGPVVIDAEAILQPELALGAPGARNALAAAGERLRRSFVATGLLTSEAAMPDGRLVEVGGMRGTGAHPSSAMARVFRGANGDAMTMTLEPTAAAPMPNLPVLDGRRLRADELPDDVAAGFAAAYQAIAARKDELLAPGGPLADYAHDETRVVLRPTDQYARLLALLCAPRHLGEGLSKSFAIDSLTRVFGASRERPPLFPLVAEERAALERLDVPVFRIPIGAGALFSKGGERLDGVVVASGMDALRERLARMGEDDLAEQMRLLRAVLLPSGTEPAWDAPASEGPMPASPRLDEEELLRRAEAIGDELLAAAIAGEEGSLTWMAPSHLQGASRADRGVSSYVYDGALGIALFLAALSKESGRDDFRLAALAACRPLASTLRSPDAARLLANEGLGAGNGLGSLVWGLIAVGTLLGQERMTVDLARRAAAHVTPARVAADRFLDVEGGAAGAILGLLALHERTADRDVLAAALACGDHLIKSARDLGDGRAGWPSAGGPPLAGLAHGAAGIAL